MVRVLSFFADATKDLQMLRGCNKKTQRRRCVFYMEPYFSLNEW